MNRRTSLYSVRVSLADAQLAELVSQLRLTGHEPTDQHVAIENGRGYASVGFRASNDYEAVIVARTMMLRLGLHRTTATLMTGHGVHRRVVTS